MSLPRRKTKVFTSNDVFVTPAGVTRVDLELQGDNGGDLIKLYDVILSPTNPNNTLSINGVETKFERASDSMHPIANPGGGGVAAYIKVIWFE